MYASGDLLPITYEKHSSRLMLFPLQSLLWTLRFSYECKSKDGRGWEFHYQLKLCN